MSDVVATVGLGLKVGVSTFSATTAPRMRCEA